MERTTLLIATAMLLLVTTGGGSAHPPGAVQLAYDQQQGEVALTVTHVVRDPATHYINRTEILRNGEPLVRESYTGQPSADTFTYRYPLDISAGDEIVATAECNVGGTGTARLIVPGVTATSPSPPGTPGIPRFVYHAVLMGAGIICITVAGLLPVYGNGISGWYRLHVITAVVGSILVVPALFLVFRTMYLSAPPSVFALHVFLGLFLLILLAVALVFALTRGRAGLSRAGARKAHIWAGRAFIALILVEVLVGLVAVGIL